MDQMERMLIDGLDGLDEDKTMAAVKALVDGGATVGRVEMLLQQGMKRAEERFAQGEYFLGDLLVAGTLFIDALHVVSPNDGNLSTGGDKGKVLVGVVNDDIHDLGKNIVVQVLVSESFEVRDLGVDVPAERFIEEIESYAPDVVALSGVMAASAEEMRKIIVAMDERGLRENIPVIIGGACATELVRERIGADAYAAGPIDTALLCRQFMQQKTK